jgi:hypothetical protein
MLVLPVVEPRILGDKTTEMETPATPFITINTHTGSSGYVQPEL